MKAVVLAGGKGSRLQPYTTILPKPLMPLGDMPILEILLRQLQQVGINEIQLAVGHLAELLQVFFRNGEKLGLKIGYSHEDQPLGTAGPISLIDDLDDVFLVMNGDVLTDLNFAELVAAHCNSDAIATVAVHQRTVKIDLGVLEIDSLMRITNYIEKPTYDYRVSMGIYVFDPRVLTYIPRGEYLDLPDLVLKLIEHEEPIQAFFHDGYWQDLGNTSDYKQAMQDYETLKPRLFGEEFAL